MSHIRLIPFLFNSSLRSEFVSFGDILQFATILAKLLVVKLNQSTNEQIATAPFTPLVLVHT